MGTDVDEVVDEVKAPEETGEEVGKEKPADTDTATDDWDSEGEKPKEDAPEDTPKEEKPAEPVLEKKFTDADMAKARRKHQGEASKEREARIRAEERARVYQEMQGGSNKQPETPQPATDTRPRRPSIEAFETREEYEKALDIHEEKVADWQARRVEQNITQKTRIQKAQEEFQTRRQTMMEKVRAAGGDDAVAIVFDNNFHISAPMRDATWEAENGGKVLAFLAENPDVFERIKKMSPVAQIREIDKLDRSIMEKTTHKTTNAPTPASTVKGGAVSSRDDSKLTDDEYWKLEDQRIAERKKNGQR